LQEWLPRAGVLGFPEMLRLVRVAATLGVDKIRVTGGEPLTRAGIIEFLRELSRVDGIKQVGLSTNGTLLDRRGRSGRTVAQELRAAGVSSLNISLDT
ncbi:MAG: GTP 3',8-cyclase MoaA, partial [Chthoniobacterales bacterium]